MRRPGELLVLLCCVVIVAVLYLSGEVAFTLASVVLQLAAWSGGAAFVILASGRKKS